MLQIWHVFVAQWFLKSPSTLGFACIPESQLLSQSENPVRVGHLPLWPSPRLPALPGASPAPPRHLGPAASAASAADPAFPGTSCGRLPLPTRVSAPRTAPL